MRGEEIDDRVRQERERQFNLPGSEYDVRNSPNDWAAIAMHYLAEEVRRGGRVPDADDYIDSLVKAAAVIRAALEHVPAMRSRGLLR